MWLQCKPTLNLQSSFRIVAVAVLVCFASSVAYADICAWRDPEKTMGKLFPNAKDYKTIETKISAEKLQSIEKRLGKPLDPGERENWSHYEIIGQNDETLGYVIADAEKGEYGVIEVVMGITPDGKTIGAYIQRSRERNTEFKAKEFLGQFIGKTKNDVIQIGSDIKATNTIPTEQVTYAVRKMLVMYDELRYPIKKSNEDV